MKTVESIDAYIAGFPEDVQAPLKQMRQAIQQAAPEATEAIKYGMPTFVLQGNLVHFAANKNHIGFYPSPSGISNFEKALEEYQTSKGAIQFPYDKKLPLSLVKKITAFRAKENRAKKSTKK